MDTLMLRTVWILICVGIYLIFRDKIYFLIRSICMNIIGKGIGQNKIQRHINRIFKVLCDGKYIKIKITVFYVLTFLIFISMSFVMIKGMGAKGIVIAIIMSLIPYGYLRARLYLIQVNGSFEGEMLIAELINQYKMAETNIYETIDNTILALPENTLSKKALFQLKIRISSYVGNEELLDALYDFKSNWNTIWSQMLVDNIYNAIKENTNIINGLENILEQGKEITKFIEADRKEGMETEVLVKILCPLFFILMLFMAKNMVGYSWSTIIIYEFTEPAGLFIFTLIVLLAAINLIVFPVLGKRKYDF